MLEKIKSLTDKTLWNPAIEKSTAIEHRLLRILRLPYALVRDLASGALNLRAMSLVYTTMLSIVPLLAFSFSVLKGLGLHKKLEPLLFKYFEPLGERGVVDVIGTVGYYGLVSLLLNVDEYPLPEGVEPELQPLDD